MMNNLTKILSLLFFMQPIFACEEPPIFDAIMKNDLEKVKQLATQESILHNYQFNGIKQSPLERALGNANSCSKILEYFITQFDCNSFNDSSGSILHNLAARHQLKLMKLSIEKGADVNELNKNEKTPLIKCMEYADIRKNTTKVISCCILLVKQGADLTQKTANYQSQFEHFKLRLSNLLHRCPLKSDTTFLPLLLFEGLNYSFKHNLKERIHKLLKFPESSDALHITDEQGNTVLHHAMNEPNRVDRHAKIKFLLMQGADPNIKNNDNKTVTDIALEQYDRPLFGLLIQFGADIWSGKPSLFEKTVANDSECKFLKGVLSRVYLEWQNEDSMIQIQK